MSILGRPWPLNGSSALLMLGVLGVKMLAKGSARVSLDVQLLLECILLLYRKGLLLELVTANLAAIISPLLLFFIVTNNRFVERGVSSIAGQVWTE